MISWRPPPGSAPPGSSDGEPAEVAGELLLPVLAALVLQHRPQVAESLGTIVALVGLVRDCLIARPAWLNSPLLSYTTLRYTTLHYTTLHNTTLQHTTPYS